jgi:hypothetical protein
VALHTDSTQPQGSPASPLPDTLYCPHCGGCEVHLARTVVFTRDHDGAATGDRYRIPARDPFVDPTSREPAFAADDDIHGNPSRDRGAVVLHFVCEGGCPTFSYQFSQHKGCTSFSVGASDVHSVENEYGYLF